jgi:Putative bacterial sensory transduction regulator
MTRRVVAGLAAGLALAVSSTAAAQGAVCPAGMICASNPQAVTDELRKLGYRAELKKHESGDPMIESAAAGFDFRVNFNDCKAGKECRSLGFVVTFADDGKNTPELANTWNRAKRFSQMAANDNGTLAFSYDVTTVGGLTKANFADVVDWWQVMLGQLRGFFAENSGK